MHACSASSGKPERASWLNEADVDFFTGGGVGETSKEPVDPEVQATIQVRSVEEPYGR